MYKPVRTLILFMSKHGTVKMIAKKIYNELDENTDLIDYNEKEPLDIDEYDKVIIGGSVYAGSIQRKLTKYVKKYEMQLLEKKIGVFICYMNPKEVDTYLNKSFTYQILNKANAIGKFGGKINFEDLNFFEKLIVKKISGIKENISELNNENIKEFINKMKN